MKKFMYAAAFVAALVACSKEQAPVQENERLNGSDSVTATAKDFVTDGATRTVITQSGSDAPAFAWKEGDVIGIIPMNNETVQFNYKISEIGTDPKQAMFDGGVWALKEGKEYAAYYPFKKETVISNESIEFSFLGQTQTANNSLAHLGAYDYMYASAVVPAAGNAQFAFEHKISLVRLQLTVPEADTFSKIALESSESWFANGASLKLSDGTMTATENVKSATINLSNIEVAANGVLTVWFAMLPTSALNGKTLSVKTFGQDEVYTGEITVITTIAAGNAYSYATILSSGGQDGPELVDLGLSVKWASFNLGATKPEEYGGYYQWAGTMDVTDKSIYLDWSNCPYHTGSSSSTGWTKYIPSGKSSYWSGTGSPDNKTVLNPEDDIAHVKLGGKWRMPTKAEWMELIDNCTWTWTSNYKGTGVNGYKVTSKKSGYAGNFIFLPAAGYRSDDCLGSAGAHVSYWSSSLCTDRPIGAYSLGFRSDSVNTYDSLRYFGRSVRPVSE